MSAVMSISEIADRIEFARSTMRTLELGLYSAGDDIDTDDVRGVLQLLDGYLEPASVAAFDLDEAAQKSSTAETAPLDRNATDPDRKPCEIDKVRLATLVREAGIDPAELVPAEERARKAVAAKVKRASKKQVRK